MKKLKVIILPIFAAMLYTVTLNAQITAVMKAKVKVISGSQLSQINNLNLDLNNPEELATKDLELFNLQADKHADINISVTEHIVMENQDGYQVQIKNDTQLMGLDNGKWSVVLTDIYRVGCKCSTPNGTHTGDIKAVIDYL